MTFLSVNRLRNCLLDLNFSTIIRLRSLSPPNPVIPDAMQHEMLLRWSGTQMSDLGPGPALQHFVPQSIRGDENRKAESLWIAYG
jgi:hypothetical protein